MSRPYLSALAALARMPISAEDRLARNAAIQAGFDAEKEWLKSPCKTSVAGFKVAVVGAGMAGLAAALTLARLGMRVRLFEARGEVGGRVQSNTTDFRARIVETGAELIGAIHPMCLSLAKQYSLAMITRTDDEVAHQMQLSSRMLIDGAFLKQKELLDLTRKMHHEVLLPIARHARIVTDPAAPWKQRTQLKPWDSVTLGGMLRKRFGIKPGSKLWQMLEILLVNDNVAPLDELNYLALLCLVRAGHTGTRDQDLMGYWEDLENFRCSDGCQMIAKHMSDDFRHTALCTLDLYTAVTAIDLAGVPRVTWSRTDTQGNILKGSQSEDFDYVVLATPPSVWRHTTVTPKDLNFPTSPGVMHLGPAIKFFTGFNERFWIKKGFAALGGADDLGQVWEGTDNQNRLPEQPLVLSVFAGGKIPSDASILSNLEKLYPDYAKLAKKQLWARWPSEPFIETGYASPAKDQVFGVGEGLNQPFAKRMCFAGEHTSMAYFGYMEGALRSGLRAARQIVGLACGTKPATKAPATPAQPAPRARTAEAEAFEPLYEDEVIGTDERRRVVDTLATPYRWICAIDLRVDDPLKGTGAPPITLDARATGILIGPRHVLTAAHVFDPKTIDVQGRERQVPVTSVRVSPARNGDNDVHPFGFAMSRTWHRSAAVKNPDDYALIVLDQDVSQRTAKNSSVPLGWWPLRRLDPAALGKPAIEVTGYPGDRCGNDAATGSPAAKEATIAQWVRTRRPAWASTMWRAPGNAQIRPQFSVVVHNADTYHGESGAPICVRSGERLEVLGVHTGEVIPTDGTPVVLNRGVRVTRRMLNELVGWINADAGRAWASVKNDALVFDASVPVKEATEPELDAGGEYETLFEFDSATEADRKMIQVAARKIDAGLRAATTALGQTPEGPTRNLVDFIVSLLRTHFFPRGFGETGADRKVIKTSARAIIAMTLEKDDGSRWAFEHRVRLWLAARRADRAWVGGEAGGEQFSVITLYVPDFGKASDSSAVSLAVHECVHMMFRLIDKLRENHGDAMAKRFVSREPWRRLDTRPFDAHRQAVAAKLEALRKLLPMLVSSDELAASLLQEGYAYTLAQWVEASIGFAEAARKKGPSVVVESSSIAPTLVRHYVLERAPNFAASLSQPEVVKAVQALAPALEAMADALRQMWGPAFKEREASRGGREVVDAYG